MASSDITGGVQAMEAEAARVLDEAKAKASDTVAKAREESRKMASAELPLADVKAEGAKLIQDQIENGLLYVLRRVAEQLGITAALGKSRRREAVAPLSALVRDPEPRVRLERVAVEAGDDPALVWIRIDYAHLRDGRRDNLVFPYYLTQ